MTKDDEQCLKLGREVVRLINELGQVAKEDTGFVRREFTFPGGSVHMLIVNDKELADLMDASANKRYDVKTIIPPSQVN